MFGNNLLIYYESSLFFGDVIPLCLCQCSAILVGGLDEGIWRVDPTGQFYHCHAAIAGRGADKARSTFLKRVAQHAKEQQQQQQQQQQEKETAMENDGASTNDNDAADAIILSVSNADVQTYLNSLSVSQAMAVACDCISQNIPASKGSLSSLVQTNTTATTNNSTNSTFSETSSVSKSTIGRLLAFSMEKEPSKDDKEQKVTWYNQKDLQTYLDLENLES